MKSALPVISALLMLTSCSAYQQGQTPDDVYYSPERSADEYVSPQRNDDRQYRRDPMAYRDDRYLRMKVRDRRYANLYDEYYSYNPYAYHYYNSTLYYNSPFNSYSYWDTYYNPSCAPSRGYWFAQNPVYYGVMRPTINRPRTFDLTVYQHSGISAGTASSGYNYHPGYSSPNSSTPASGNYRNSGSSAGDFLRNSMGRSSSSSSGSSSTPSSSGGSSHSASPAPVRRF